MIWSILLAVLVGAIAIAHYIGSKYSTPPLLRKEEDLAKNRKKGDGTMLSIVIPAYNEEERIAPTLVDMAKFCKAHSTSSEPASSSNAARAKAFDSFEMIIVDDCSKDKTNQLAQDFKKKNPDVDVAVLKVNPNHGKGYAVRTGFLHSKGDFVLMADADNATQIADVAKVLYRMKDTKSDIGIGSRSHLEQDSIAQRTFLRTVLMKVFHLVVAICYFVSTHCRLCPFQDTQCGFKVFDRKKCRRIFLNSRLERWAFDVELLIHARKFGVKGVEVPVRWAEIPGSKVSIKGMVQMGLECLLMCFTYGFGLWSLLPDKV